MSWQARLFDGYARLVLRRRHWGSPAQLARRARRLWGMPAGWRGLGLRGLRHRLVAESGVRGEWLGPPQPRRGVVLYLHGGGYVACAADTHRPVTTALARLTECRVFSADYRLAPEFPFPAAFDDAVATYQWLLDRGAPGEPIAIAGESAGGGLTLALAVRVRDAGWRAPACLVAFSPWTDLAGTGDSLRANDGCCVMFRPENIPAFAAAYLAGAPADDPRASPLYADLSRLPPTLIQVGSTELILDDARRVHDRIVAARGTSRLTVYPRAPHAWQLLMPWLPEARVSLGEAADFVGTHLGP